MQLGETRYVADTNIADRRRSVKCVRVWDLVAIYPLTMRKAMLYYGY